METNNKKEITTTTDSLDTNKASMSVRDYAPPMIFKTAELNNYDSKWHVPLKMLMQPCREMSLEDFKAGKKTGEIVPFTKERLALIAEEEEILKCRREFTYKKQIEMYGMAILPERTEEELLMLFDMLAQELGFTDRKCDKRKSEELSKSLKETTNKFGFNSNIFGK